MWGPLPVNATFPQIESFINKPHKISFVSFLWFRAMICSMTMVYSQLLKENGGICMECQALSITCLSSLCLSIIYLLPICHISFLSLITIFLLISLERDRKYQKYISMFSLLCLILMWTLQRYIICTLKEILKSSSHWEMERGVWWHHILRSVARVHPL